MDQELRSLLLVMEERGRGEPMVLERAMRGDWSVRRHLALLLGRSPGTGSLASLLVLLGDERAEVREAAAWALARRQIDDGEALALSGAVLDPDGRVARQAIRSLLRAGRSDLLASGVLMEGRESRLRLAASLPGAGVEEAEGLALEVWRSSQQDDLTRRWAAAALSRGSSSEVSIEVAREMVTSTDHWIRGWGASLLATLGSSSDLALLQPLLDDESSFVQARSIEAMGRLARRYGGALDPQTFVDRLDHPSARVSAAAIASLGEFIHDEGVRDLLYRRWAGTGGPDTMPTADAARRAQLLEVLAREPQDGRLVDSVVSAALDPAPHVRVAAVEVAFRLGLPRVIERLDGDRSARVRSAWLRGRLGDLINGATVAASEGVSSSGPRTLGAWVERVRSDPSPELRRWAYLLLVAAPRATLEELLDLEPNATLPTSWPIVDRDSASRSCLALAVGARGLAERFERGAIIGLLESAASSDPSSEVRLAARDMLLALGQSVRLPPGRVDVARQKALALQAWGPGTGRDQTRLVMETSVGNVVWSLDFETAPRHAVSLLHLAQQGYYDGQEIELDSRGDSVVFGDATGLGTGDAGYRKLPELGPSDLEEHGIVLGVPSLPLGGGLGGSQFRITLSPQPWLSGKETVVGEVVSGLEVLDRISSGVVIQRVRVLSEPPTR